MGNKFLEVLVSEGILADGAIGTEIYRRGVFINRCYDELNCSSPDLIREIHADYVDAGARLIKTNTFTANRAALSAYGLEDKTDLINAAGVKIAREVAGRDIFVAGSVGPISSSAPRRGKGWEWEEAFSEQITALAGHGVDVILLETFTNLDELEVAIKAARGASDLPIIAEISVQRVEEEEDIGFMPEEAVSHMADADVVGVNCSGGPQGVFEALKRMTKVTDKPLSAMPNAGMPQIVQGRMLYLATPEYMAEYARRYSQLGVNLIGGCCGTTPRHIKEMKKYLKAFKPRAHAVVRPGRKKEERPATIPQKPAREKGPFGGILGEKFAISVEVDPPLGVDVSGVMEGVRFLRELGVDAVNIADGPRAVPRMSPIALASLIKEKVGIQTIVHYCCRDRNLFGMQMDLLGAAAMGLNNVLIITGDPPKTGPYPEATAVFDLDSIGLISLAVNLNSGLDFASRPLKGATSLLIGCGCNPGAVDVDLEAERFRQKVEAGAEFTFSQPAYDLKILDRFLERIKGVKPIPFFVGVLPLASLKNAEFLHNEVPGMQVPKNIMDRLRKESTRDGQRKVGLEVAHDILKYARELPQVSGAYIFPPFGKYRLVEELLR